MSRYGYICFFVNCIFGVLYGCYCFELCVKVDFWFFVECVCVVVCNVFFVVCEVEYGKGYRNRDVDFDLFSFNFVFECFGCGIVFCKDGNIVVVFVFID